MLAAGDTPNLDRLRVQLPVDPARRSVQRCAIRDERTGAAKTRVPSKKKKEIYGERRIISDSDQLR